MPKSSVVALTLTLTSHSVMCCFWRLCLRAGIVGASMSAVTVSAPGKVILHGEHSVVYGKKALAVSIGLRTRVRIRRADAGRQEGLRVELLDLERCHSLSREGLQALREEHPLGGESEGLEQDLVQAVRDLLFRELEQPEQHADNGLVALVYLYVLQARRLEAADQIPGMVVRVESDIPVGAGLGSSAAFSVALAGAFMRAIGGGGGGGASPDARQSKRRRKDVAATNSSINNNNNNDSVDRRKATSSKNGVVPHAAANGNGVHNGVSNGNASNGDSNGVGAHEQEEEEEEAFSAEETDLICKRAFLAEKIIHGNPSGECIEGGGGNHCWRQKHGNPDFFPLPPPFHV